MEITSFRDLWGFCRERSGGEQFAVTLEGSKARLFIDYVDGIVEVCVEPSKVEKPVTDWPAYKS